MKKILFLLFTLFTFSCNGQENIQTLINGIISDMPGKDGKEYTVPSLLKLTRWEGAVYSISHDDLQTADSLLSLINYTLTVINEDGETYYVLNGKNYGTYIFNLNPERPDLVIQVPHPLNDMNTGQEGIYMFKYLDAKAFFIAGTHRYNNGLVSDVAHNNNNFFQVATEVVFDEFPKTTFIQFHGFAQKETDPDIVISYGVLDTSYFFYTTSPALSIKISLSSSPLNVLINDNGQHRLTAYTNAQGRYINNTSKHQFIHIEQSLGVRKSYHKEILTALENAFPVQNKNTIINIKDKEGNILFYLNLGDTYNIISSETNIFGTEYTFQKQ